MLDANTKPVAEPATTEDHLGLAEHYVARNYAPLPVVLAGGEGARVTDVEGRRYLDCLAGYSALNFGHRHPVLVQAAREQLDRLTLTSRAFHDDQLGPFCRDLAALAGMDRVLPMNTGAEAVETAIKVARKWGHERKAVPADRGNIVVAAGNFHGRTTTIVSFSTDPVARDGYGPFAPGFRVVPYGDTAAVREATDADTLAVLIEPIQGEAGVVIPPPDYLPALRQHCTDHDVLLIADEIQSGLGRTGSTFACEHEGVVPDLYLLGKALGGAIVPISAVVSRDDVLDVMTPGTHGSTFGGNPLATAVGRAVVGLLETGEYQQRARDLGRRLARLESFVGRGLSAVRVRGLWAGIDIDPGLMSGRVMCERLLDRGILAKDTHGSTIRLAPPLVIVPDEVEWLVDQVGEVLTAG